MKTLKLLSFIAAAVFIPAAVVSAQTDAPATPAPAAAPAAKTTGKPAAKKPRAKAKTGVKPAAKPAAAAAAATAAPAAQTSTETVVTAPPAAPASAPEASPLDAAAQKLDSSDPQLRRQGADALARSRDQKAAPYLVKALSDETPAVRSAAVDGLCQLSKRDATPAITDLLLKDPDAGVRQQAAGSLSYMMDQSAGPALVKALKDPVMAVRYSAANTLGAMKYAPAEDALIEALSQADMRRIAISALGQLQSKKAASTIAASLSDQDKYTRLEAVKALGSIGDTSSAAGIKKLLDSAEDPSLRVEAALSLAKLGMADGLQTAYDFVKSHDLSLKSRALDVLGTVGDARSLQLMEEAYASETDPMTKSMYDFTRQRLAARLKMQQTAP